MGDDASEPSRWVVVWWSPERREALFADKALAEAYAAAHHGRVVPMVAMAPWPQSDRGDGNRG